MLHTNKFFSKEKRFWEKNKIKIASTCFAFFIWFLVVSNGSFEYETDLPIICPEQTHGFIIVSDIPSKAQIRIRGQGKALLSFLIFREGNIQISPKWEAGTQIVRPTLTDIRLYGNSKKLTLLEITSPDSFQIKIEKYISKSVPIKNNVLVKPLAGYTIVDDITLTPSHIEISGAQSVVDTCDSIYTKADYWDKLKLPIEKPIDLIQPKTDLLRISESNTVINADIQKLMERRLYNISVNVINIPDNMKALVIPSSLSLIIQGGVDVVAKVQEKILLHL